MPATRPRPHCTALGRAQGYGSLLQGRTPRVRHRGSLLRGALVSPKQHGAEQHERTGRADLGPPLPVVLPSTPVSFELGQQDGAVVRVPPVARQHPQLVEVVEGVLAERPHQPES